MHDATSTPTGVSIKSKICLIDRKYPYSDILLQTWTVIVSRFLYTFDNFIYIYLKKRKENV